MKIIRPKSWAGFKRAIEDVRKEFGTYIRELDNGEVYKMDNRILFRGQADSEWPLQTTLERATHKRLHVLQYLNHATRGVKEIESFTGNNWHTKPFPEMEKEINEKQDTFRVCLPSYDYLVYLRHHGFPSPLLDWTESPYIAAFFAFSESVKSKRVAIYCYIERPESVKGGTGGSPMITVQGPYVKTHKRHFAQKAWYTVATKWEYSEERHYFCKHEDIFNSNEFSKINKQDVLIKIELPTRIRKEALKELSDYNINFFTLFQSEDSLIKTIAMKTFDQKDA